MKQLLTGLLLLFTVMVSAQVKNTKAPTTKKLQKTKQQPDTVWGNWDSLVYNRWHKDTSETYGWDSLLLGYEDTTGIATDDATVPVRFDFYGRQPGDTTGVIDYGMRLYDPRIGRYMPMDATHTQRNPYGYVKKKSAVVKKKKPLQKAALKK